MANSRWVYDESVCYIRGTTQSKRCAEACCSITTTSPCEVTLQTCNRDLAVQKTRWNKGRTMIILWRTHYETLNASQNIPRNEIDDIIDGRDDAGGTHQITHQNYDGRRAQGTEVTKMKQSTLPTRTKPSEGLEQNSGKTFRNLEWLSTESRYCLDPSKRANRTKRTGTAEIRLLKHQISKTAWLSHNGIIGWDSKGAEPEL